MEHLASRLTRVNSRVDQVVQDGNHDVQDLAALEDVVEELLVEVAKLPEQDEHLLMKVDLFAGSWQKCLDHWVVQQTTESLEYEPKVLKQHAWLWSMPSVWRSRSVRRRFLPRLGGCVRCS